jgi:hypothetical protein
MIISRKVIFRISLFTFMFLALLTVSAQEPTRAELDYVIGKHISDYFPAGDWGVESIKSIGNNGDGGLYLIDLSPEGWVIVSGDIRAEAILAYSPEGDYIIEDDIIQNPANNWLNVYEEQIGFIVDSEVSEISSSWLIGNGPKSSSLLKSTISIEPIIEANYNQGTGWNQFCPVDNAGPGGHVLVGCVAVAMAQAISTFDYPITGSGEHSYNHAIYGNLSVDYSDADYDWDNMSRVTPDENNSKLLYHCAVSVSMNFGTSGSSASTSNTPEALRSHFLFSRDMMYESKVNYSEEDWRNLLIEQLLNGRPIIYRGESVDGASGHSFNVDGVRNGLYFHFNWGWGGKNNGYYTLSSLTPGTRDYTTDQRAVLNLQPYFYPTDLYLSNYIVPKYELAGYEVAEISVIDEAPNNEYQISVASDSTFLEGEWVMDYKIEESTLITGVDFSGITNMVDTIVLTVTDLHGTSLLKEVILLFGNATGDDDIDLGSFESIMVYPNPASEYISLSEVDNSEEISVIIYSQNGMVVKHEMVYPGEQLDISDLERGIYILVAKSSTGRSLTRKVIKN